MLKGTFNPQQELVLQTPDDDWQLHQTLRSAGFPSDEHFETPKFRGHDYSMGTKSLKPLTYG